MNYEASVGEEYITTKKFFSLIALLFLALAYSFSDVSSFGFDIVWYKQTQEETSLSVLDYSSETVLVTKALDISLERQNLCKIRLVSNKGGIHKLTYRATPLACPGYTAGYKLAFSYNDNTRYLVVGNSEALYPEEGSEVFTEISIPYGSVNITSDVLVEIELTDLDDMNVGNYSATIFVERAAT